MPDLPSGAFAPEVYGAGGLAALFQGVNRGIAEGSALASQQLQRDLLRQRAAAGLRDEAGRMRAEERSVADWRAGAEPKQPFDAEAGGGRGAAGGARSTGGGGFLQDRFGGGVSAFAADQARQGGIAEIQERRPDVSAGLIDPNPLTDFGFDPAVTPAPDEVARMAARGVLNPRAVAPYRNWYARVALRLEREQASEMASQAQAQKAAAESAFAAQVQAMEASLVQQGWRASLARAAAPGFVSDLAGMKSYASDTAGVRRAEESDTAQRMLARTAEQKRTTDRSDIAQQESRDSALLDAFVRQAATAGVPEEDVLNISAAFRAAPATARQAIRDQFGQFLAGGPVPTLAPPSPRAGAAVPPPMTEPQVRAVLKTNGVAPDDIEAIAPLVVSDPTTARRLLQRAGAPGVDSLAELVAIFDRLDNTGGAGPRVPGQQPARRQDAEPTRRALRAAGWTLHGGEWTLPGRVETVLDDDPTLTD